MSEPASPLLVAFDLKKDFETPAGNLEVLRSVDLMIPPGEMAFIVGRSGSGKSTLLHLLGGLDQPTSGKVLFEGKDLAQMSEKEISRLRNGRIGFVFQFYHLLPELTVFENILLPTLIAGKKNKKGTKEILKRVKLWNRRNHFPSELSGGEQQRVAIARALVNRPSVVLCDEPTGNLDRETAESIMDLLKELNVKEGRSFLIVTHDETLAMPENAIFRLEDGVIRQAVKNEPIRTEKLF